MLVFKTKILCSNILTTLLCITLAACSSHTGNANVSSNKSTNKLSEKDALDRELSTLEVPQAAKYETYVTAGQSFPLTTVTSIDGKTIDLTSSKSQKLVILFATWCSDSQRAMNALRTSSLLVKPDLEIVAIARENTVEEVKQFKQDYQLNINFVADVDRSIYKQFASAGIPRFIMVDDKNIVANAVLAEGDNQLNLIRW